MRLVREVLAAEETRHGTDIAGALRFLNGVQKRKAVVFLISDFLDDGFIPDLRVTARRHDVICCPVSDPAETELPAVGLVEVQDPETGELVVLDTASAEVRAEVRAAGEAHAAHLRDTFRKLKIDTLVVSTERPFVDDLRRLFRQRQMRAMRG
jgi:uncharacterized protein (DUF58 family)